MTIKQTLFFFITTFFFQATQAQQEFGLYFLNDTWQSNKVNPAFMTDQKLTISLPGFSNSLYFTGPTYGDLVTERGGETVIDIDQAVLKMNPENTVREDLQIETLNVALQVSNWQFSLGHSLRTTAFLVYPKTLPQVIWQGNAQFIGETIDVSNKVLLQSFHELAFGAARKFGDKLTFGAKIKYLNGLASAYTNPDHNNISIRTDDEFYELGIETDYQLNSTGVVAINSLSDFDLDFKIGDSASESLITKNVGWGFDAGVSLELDKLTLSASVLDIGSITWKDSTRTYSTKGNFEYSGLDISGALTGEDVSFDNVVDTLDNLLEISETQSTYDISLPRKFYLGAAYQLTEKLRTGLVYFNEKFEEDTFSGISASVNWKPNSVLSIGATYSALFEQEEFANIGISGILKLGPVQVFAVTDNIVSLFQVDNSNIFHGRVGVNLLLNSKKNRE